MRYNSKIIAYYENSQYVGSLSEHPAVKSILVGTPESGDVIKLFIETKANQIITAKFQAQASVVTIACCAFICEWLIGKTFQDAQALSPNWLSNELELPEIKKHCALLVIDALQSIIANCK